MFTSLLILNLYSEKRIDIYKNVNEIDSRFSNIQIPLIELLRFNCQINTPGRIDESYENEFIYTSGGGRKLLHNTTIVNNNFQYSNIPYMITSELIPNFQVEMQKFIKQMRMEHTEFNPKRSISKLGIAHDPKAQVMNGITDSAGLFSTTVDLTKIINILINMDSKLVRQMIKPHNKENKYSKDNKMGMVYIKHPKGLEISEVPNLSAYRSMAIAGFTGTWALYDVKNGYTANFLSNPLSNETGIKDKGYVYAMDPYKEEMVYTSLMLKIANAVLSNYNNEKFEQKSYTKHIK